MESSELKILFDFDKEMAQEFDKNFYIKVLRRFYLKRISVAEGKAKVNLVIEFSKRINELTKISVRWPN